MIFEFFILSCFVFTLYIKLSIFEVIFRSGNLETFFSGRRLIPGVHSLFKFQTSFFLEIFLLCVFPSKHMLGKGPVVAPASKVSIGAGSLGAALYLKFLFFQARYIESDHNFFRNVTIFDR